MLVNEQRQEENRRAWKEAKKRKRGWGEPSLGGYAALLKSSSARLPGLPSLEVAYDGGNKCNKFS